MSSGQNTIFEQAHVGHPVGHVNIDGILIMTGAGAVIGGVLGSPTGPAGIGVGGVTGAGVGKSIGEMIFPPQIPVIENSDRGVMAGEGSGRIVDGSPDTFIGRERQRAARATAAEPKTRVSCHGGEYVIQGSDTVFINRCSASRKTDGTSEGGLITQANETVYTGGEKLTLFEFGAFPTDANRRMLWGLSLALDALGIIVAPPRTLLGTFVAGAQVLSIGDQVLRGPSGSGPMTAAADAIKPAGGAAELLHALRQGSAGRQGVIDGASVLADLIKVFR